MNQLRKAKSRNPRRHAVLPRKYIKVVVTYVLLFAIVFSNRLLRTSQEFYPLRCPFRKVLSVFPSVAKAPRHLIFPA